MKGTWETTSGGGDAVAAAVAVAAGAVVIAAACAAAKAAASIPAYVWVTVPAVIVTATTAVVVILWRYNRRQAALFAVRRADAIAAENVRLQERRRYRLEVAAASAPVIHNHVHTGADALAGMIREYARPTTIVTGEIER